jgi:hypothetical protein
LPLTIGTTILPDFQIPLPRPNPLRSSSNDTWPV